MYGDENGVVLLKVKGFLIVVGVVGILWVVMVIVVDNMIVEMIVY